MPNIDWNQFTQSPNSPTTTVSNATVPNKAVDWNQFVSSSDTSHITNKENAVTAPSQNTVRPQSSNPLVQLANSDAVNKVVALGGGLADTTAKAVSGVGGLVGDLTNSQTITKASDALGNAIIQNKPDFVKTQMQEHPNYALAGNIASGVTAMGVVGGAVGAIGTAKGLSNTAINMISNAVIGATTAGHGLANRAIGAGAGATLAKVGDVAGGLVGKAVKNVSASDALKELVAKANNYLEGNTTAQAVKASITNMWNAAKDTENKLYNSFKSTPGTVNAAPLGNAAGQAAKNLGDVMTQAQKGFFNAVEARASNVSNLDSAHELDKLVNGSKSMFDKSGTAPDVIDAYKNIKNLSNTNLEWHADIHGAGDQLRQAKDFHMNIIAPLQKIKADDIAGGTKSVDGILNKFVKNSSNSNIEGTPDGLKQILNAMDPKGRQIITTNLIQRVASTINIDSDVIKSPAGIKLLDGYIKNYGAVLGEDSTNQLKGIREVLDQVSKNKASGFIDKLKELGGASAIGAGIGMHQAGPVGGLLGAGIAPVVKQIIDSALEHPMGRATLEAIGNNENIKFSSQLINQLVKGFSSAAAGKVVKNVIGNNDANDPNNAPNQE